MFELQNAGHITCYSYKEKSNGSTKASLLHKELCRRFSFAEIVKATNDFYPNWVIGKGGFGCVYKGYIDNGSTVVAVKRLNPNSKQGAKQFLTEIQMLSQLRYTHLVSLIYEYLEKVSLLDHLFGSNNDPLSWKQRLEICVGAARGLHYLHTGVKHTIVHLDVKTTNILLDEKWNAKVSDFGLSKVGSSEVLANILLDEEEGAKLSEILLSKSGAASTMDKGTFEYTIGVKGTLGYLDPEYARSRRLTETSDVYSFSVVLFEVLWARKPVDTKLEEAQYYLPAWVRKFITKGTIQNIIDPFLMGKIAPECFKKFVEVAESCTRIQRIQRPTMGDVMEKLELALELQEQADTEMVKMYTNGVYSSPLLLFRVCIPGQAVSDSQSGIGLTSLGSDDTIELSFSSVETESTGTGDMHVLDIDFLLNA